MSYPTKIDTVVVVGDSIHFPIKETLLKTGNNKIELNLNRTKNTDKKPVTVVGSEISLKFKELKSLAINFLTFCAFR